MGLVAKDHAPIEVTLNKKKYKSNANIPKLQPAFQIIETAKGTADMEVGKEERTLQRRNHRERVEVKFRDAERRGDVEAMLRLWTRATISAIKEINRGAGTATFTEKTFTCPVHPGSHTATSQKQRRLAKFAERIREAAAQQKHKESVAHQSKQLNEQTELKLQQLWGNTTKDVPEDDPYNKC